MAIRYGSLPAVGKCATVAIAASKGLDMTTCFQSNQERSMKHERKSRVEIRDVAPGLWLWRLEHSRWKAGQGWEPIVASRLFVLGCVRTLRPSGPSS